MGPVRLARLTIGLDYKSKGTRYSMLGWTVGVFVVRIKYPLDMKSHKIMGNKVPWGKWY